MIRLIVNIMILVSFGCNAFGQLQPLLDQYHLNGLAINPAYAGSKGALNISLYARNQWVGFEGAPKAHTFSMHSPLRNKKVNLGLIFLSEQIGSQKETGILGNYAYRMQIGEGKLALGIAAGFTRISSDLNLIRYNDSGDALLQDLFDKSIMPEFSFGTYYNSDTYYLGFSMPQMTSHKLNEITQKISTVFDPSSINYMLTSGYLFRISNHFEILPSILFKTNPSQSTQLDMNCNVIFKEKIWLGTGIRTNGNISSTLQLQVNSQLRFAYSYGYESSEISSYQKGSHEIMLLYNFRYILDVLSPRYF